MFKWARPPPLLHIVALCRSALIVTLLLREKEILINYELFIRQRSVLLFPKIVDQSTGTCLSFAYSNLYF